MSVLALTIACLLIWQLNANWWALMMSLWLFFVGFNLLEASLPSLVAKYAPAAHKGTAMGAFSSSQFLGAFFGATAAGFISQHLQGEILSQAEFANSFTDFGFVDHFIPMLPFNFSRPK